MLTLPFKTDDVVTARDYDRAPVAPVSISYNATYDVSGRACGHGLGIDRD